MPGPDSAKVLQQIDHLIYGAPDLEVTVAALEDRFGVRASKGGSHPGEGTRNALYSLGAGVYLEILAIDPDQPDPNRPRWLGIDDLEQPRILTWVAKGSNLGRLVVQAAEEGVHLGPVLAGSRHQSDGSNLHWHVTDPHVTVADGIVPFFIDWRDTPHPSQSAAKGLVLKELRGEHPDVGGTRQTLQTLGLKLPVDAGATAALIATLDTPRGLVELR
ncbi:MAG: VOC family protein [Acidobacteriota bacterium]